MNKDEIIEKLSLFGLTKQESSIYLCLIDNSELTGYEVAKLTGISRSNVYGALANMLDKGAVYMITGTPVRYSGMTLEEFCTNRIREMEQAKQLLEQFVQPKDNSREGYVTIEGFRNIKNKVYTMIARTEHRIYISAPAEYIKLFKSELSALVSHSRKVVILSEEVLKIAGCEQYISKKNENQLRLIVDSGYVLTGDVSGSSSDTCLYSEQVNFVNVFKEAMRNEIELIKLNSTR